MTKLRNFFNPVSNDNRLFTAEEVGAMSPREFAANEKAIDYQMENVGVPRNSDLAGNSDVVYVHEYTRSDGTKVKAHYRSKHGGTLTGAAARNVHDAVIDKAAQAAGIALTPLNMGMNINNPDASFLTNISLLRPEVLPPISSTYTYIKPGFAEYFNNKYDLQPIKRIGKDWAGFEFNSNSSLSKNASNSLELQQKVRSMYNNRTGEFTSKNFEVTFSNDENLHRALGTATILEPRIDSEGYFCGTLFDKYDFAPKGKDAYDKNRKSTIANNIFARFQEANISKPYYFTAPVRFKW